MINVGFKIKATLFALTFFFIGGTVSAQVEWMPWGNIKGIRVDGELMKFETSLRAIKPDWSGYTTTEKYNWEDTQTYEVGKNSRTISHALLSMPVKFTTKMESTGKGLAEQTYSISAIDNVNLAGLYYCVELPSKDFEGAKLKLINGTAVKGEATLGTSAPVEKVYVKSEATKVVIEAANRTYAIAVPKGMEVFVRQDFIGHPHYLNDPWPTQSFASSDPLQKVADYQIYFTLNKGKMKKGLKKEFKFDIKVDGAVDKEPVVLSLEANNPGNKFDGISGNYRWQFPEKDPQVIKYLLDSLRVTWGRVAFFWNDWQPEENMDPIANAKAGKLDKHFMQQVELTRLLASKHIPIMISVWIPPKWAVDPNRKVAKGVVLDNSKLTAISKSIATYLTYLKQEYGIEAETFSFNETDCGVEVFQTPQDHYIQTKAIGEYLADHNFKTKMLIGDTGHGTAKANELISVIENDPSVHRYGAAIAFHTYHGCNPEDLAAWKRSAQKMNLPLMVTEAGLNSAIHRYRNVFLEQWFQLDEIALYLRICNTVQPATIMEWQFTSDYSVLIGDGNYDDNGPLRPTQRYWNLKQLGASPEGAFALPVKSSKSNVVAAAFGDIANGKYAVHVVNNGPTRNVKLTGIPESVKSLKVYVTDINRGMEEGKEVAVVNGEANLELESLTYTSLMSY